MHSEIFVEVDNTARTNGRTGIQSVVRGLIRGLQAAQYSVRPVRWSFERGFLTPLKPSWRRNLGMGATDGTRWPVSSLFHPRCWPSWVEPRRINHRISIDWHPAYVGRLRRKWLLLPELMESDHARSVTEFARERKMRVAGIFHDAIAWKHPATVQHWTSRQHAAYMRAFADLDVVIAVSRESAAHFLEFLESENLPPPVIRVCGLAAEMPGEVRTTTLQETAGDPLKILCVSTLEPRKNHIGVLNAFQEAVQCLRSRVNLELHLVGAPYDAAPEIAGGILALTRRNPSLIWHPRVDRQELADHYRSCDFTIFGSSIEGFGIPVLESLWFGKPCLCSNQGPMAENAEGGGCLTVDVRAPHALAGGIVRLAAESGLRHQLAQEAITRPLKTWEGYARDILAILKEVGASSEMRGRVRARRGV
jgi:glycosyltransferase involved in cell wall biosynthesis